jgi:hypothetical protein
MMNIIEMFEEKYGLMDMATDKNLWAQRLTAFREGWEARGLWDDEMNKKFDNLLSDGETLRGEKEEGQ